MECRRRILISLILFLLILPVVSNSALAFSGEGSGTQTDPYLITDWNEWTEITEDNTAYYKLENNLDETTDGYNTVVDDGDGYDPFDFYGTLYGGNNSIEDVWFFKGSEVGLFAELEGNVSDLSLINFDLQGGNKVGALAGYLGFNCGDIENVYVYDSTISGDDMVGGLAGESNVGNDYIRNVGVENTEITGHDYVGGLVGYGDRIRMENVYSNNLNVKGNRNVGGVVGMVDWISDSIEYIYSTNSIVEGEQFIGGLVGQIDSSDNFNLRYGYSSNYINASGQYIGGIVGRVRDDINNDVEEVYFTGKITEDWDSVNGGALIGRIIDGNLDGGYFNHEIETELDGVGATEGFGDYENVEGLNRSEMIGSYAIGNMTALDFTNIWDTVESADPDSTVDNYPLLQNIDRQQQLEHIGEYTDYDVVEIWKFELLVADYDVVEIWEFDLTVYEPTVVETWNFTVGSQTIDVVETWELIVQRAEMIETVEEWTLTIQSGTIDVVETWELKLGWDEIDPVPLLFKVGLIASLFGFIAFRMKNISSGSDVLKSIGYITAFFILVVIMWYIFPLAYEWALQFLA